MFKITENCVNCGICVRECPNGALYEVNGIVQIDTDKCSECGLCAEICIISGVEYE